MGKYVANNVSMRYSKASESQKIDPHTLSEWSVIIWGNFLHLWAQILGGGVFSRPLRRIVEELGVSMGRAHAYVIRSNF